MPAGHPHPLSRRLMQIAFSTQRTQRITQRAQRNLDSLNAFCVLCALCVEKSLICIKRLEGGGTTKAPVFRSLRYVLPASGVVS